MQQPYFSVNLASQNRRAIHLSLCDGDCIMNDFSFEKHLLRLLLPTLFNITNIPPSLIICKKITQDVNLTNQPTNQPIPLTWGILDTLS